jgi:ubiquinone biosynthesis protein
LTAGLGQVTGMSLSLRPQHLNRYREIAVVLARHGRAGLVRSAGLDTAVEAAELDDPSDSEGDRPAELAADLEKLGPTFVRLGQLLSTRADLLPQPYVTALTRLQDKCEPFPFAEVEEVVQNELGARMSRLFEDFDNVPIAAASLGQVHRAQLRGGQQVAVKVQRPGIRKQMASDLEILGELAEFFDTHSERAKRYAVGDAFEQFRRTLVAELDYRREAANLTALQAVLRDRQKIVVPAPVDNLTTSRVLTMEFVEGRKVTDLGPLARIDLDLAPLADELFGCYLQQILDAGLFHADPHPGNILITPDQRLALLDLGMVGRIRPEVRRLIAKLLAAVLADRLDDVVRAAKGLGTAQDDYDDVLLTRTIADLVATFAGSPLDEVDVGRTLMELSRRSADAGLRPAPELALLGKTLLNLDMVVSALDPDFDTLAAMRRHVPQLMQSQTQGLGGALASAMEAKEFIEELPRRLNRAMDAVGDGHFQLKVQAFDETQFLKGLHRLANVGAAGLVLAALIVGSALLASSHNAGSSVSRTIALVVFVAAAAASAAMLAWIGLAGRKVRVRRRD